MNRLLRIVSICLITIAAFHVSKADQSDIPTDAWKNSSKGFTLAMILTNYVKLDPQNGGIKMYFKNTSNAVEFVADDGRDSGIKLFYVNAQGARIPIRHHNDRFANEADPVAIQPGETLSRTVILSSDELALITSCPVGCWVFISNQEMGGYQKIEFSPKMLISGP